MIIYRPIVFHIFNCPYCNKKNELDAFHTDSYRIKIIKCPLCGQNIGDHIYDPREEEYSKVILYDKPEPRIWQVNDNSTATIGVY